MKPFSPILTGVWFIILLNLLMAFGSIWIFLRMTPAIETIIDQNDKSLHACEDMLAAIALNNYSSKSIEKQTTLFFSAYQKARGNITEKLEKDYLDNIAINYIEAFNNNPNALKITIESIQSLSKINRAAMLRADRKAQQLGNAGAWGIVFMAISIFISSMIFKRYLYSNLIQPMDELNSVIEARQNGDTIRRFFPSDMPKNIRKIFLSLNNILDNSR